MSNDDIAFPTGWERIKLSDVLQLNYGKALSAKVRDNIGFPVYGSNGIVGYHSQPLLSGPVLLVGRKGSIGEVHFCDGACSAIDTTYFVSEFYGQPIRYWFHRLRSLPLADLNRATALPGLNRQDVHELDIEIPPLAEQLRIVEKIEELQARSRKAREALVEVGPLLEQFRQSLLAAAFRGDLTADWRAANPNVEPASELLTRIRQERRQKWEQSELAKYEAKGKLPPKGWKERYQEPDPAANLILPDIPTSWCWCALDELATHQSGYAFKSNHFSTDGIQVIKLGNLYQGRFDLSRDPAYLPGDHIDAEAARVIAGDILVSQTGTRYKRDYGFFVLVPPGSEPLLLNQRVLAVRPVRPTLSEWVVYSSQLKCYRDYFFSTETGGVNQGNVGVGGIMRGPIPLAPEKEIAEISSRLADAYASINEIVVSCSASETDLTQLDQSILAKAFRGELVPQDPNDEPASVLLERIRTSRDAVKNDQTRKSKRPSGKKPLNDRP